MTKKKSNTFLSSFEKFFTKENLPLIFLIVLVVFAVVSILVSFIAMNIPIVPVCFIVVLEGLLAALLNRIPLWIHGLVFISQIVCGIVSGKLIFMILMAFVYVFAIAFLFAWSHHE